ncbi:tetratricopeptide repeat protein [Nitrospira sp. KM1]|uniref:tetratricopeptide repeat protein n=1 Tax=Nitrospira sp. KM1 TaxID=1936990 RepID=UPI0015656D17|nr:tetratricopeptide repeat protein [Nitrospira sp. KM1]
MIRRIRNRFLAAVCLVLLTACEGRESVPQCGPGSAENQQGVQSFSALILRKRDHTSAYLARAKCLYFIGSYEPALQDLNEVIRRRPRQAEAYLYRAKIEKMLKRTLQALEDYSTSIRLEPTAEAYYDRGVLYLKEFTNKDGEALEDFNGAVGLDPKHIPAYKARAEILRKYGQYLSALQDAETILRLDPSSPRAYCGVGIAHYALGQESEGKKFLNMCFEKDPSPRIRDHYENEARKAQHARQPRRGGGGIMSEDQEVPTQDLQTGPQGHTE